MEYEFIINPEIEKICEAKAKEAYDLEKQIHEMKPSHEIDIEYVVRVVKEEIYHKMLIGKPENIPLREYNKAGSEAKKAWYTLRAKYAEDAVKKVMEGQ